MSNKELLKAELRAAELEEQFLEAKRAHEAGDLSYEDYRKVKQGFHDARVAFRQLREAEQQEIAEGDAVATPETISLKGKVKT